METSLIFSSQIKSRANDFRIGADGKLGPIDFSFLQGFRRFRDASFINLGPTPGINLNPTAASLTSFNRNEPTRGNVNFTRFSAHTLVAKKLDITGRIVYSNATSSFCFYRNLHGQKLEPQNHRIPSNPTCGHTKHSQPRPVHHHGRHQTPEHAGRYWRDVAGNR